MASAAPSDRTSDSAVTKHEHKTRDVIPPAPPPKCRMLAPPPKHRSPAPPPPTHTDPEEEVVLGDPLDRLDEIGGEGEGVSYLLLTVLQRREAWHCHRV